MIFCQALFSKFFVSYRTWSVLGFSALAGTFGRLLVLFALLPAGTQKSFFCLSAWRSSIIPYAGPLCKPFLHFFRLFFALCIHQPVFRSVSGDVLTFLPPFLRKNSRRTKSAAALRGFTSQPALCDDPPHTGQVDPTQQMLQYDQHGILLSDRPFQPNSPFSKNRSSFVKLPPPKRLSSGPRP